MESLRERHERIVSELKGESETFTAGEKAAIDWLESPKPWDLPKESDEFLYDYLQIITLYVERMRGISLKEARERVGLSRYAVVKKTGVPGTTFQHWENGEFAPTPNTWKYFEKVCELLGVDTKEITF